MSGLHKTRPSVAAWPVQRLVGRNDIVGGESHGNDVNQGPLPMHNTQALWVRKRDVNRSAGIRLTEHASALPKAFLCKVKARSTRISRSAIVPPTPTARSARWLTNTDSFSLITLCTALNPLNCACYMTADKPSWSLRKTFLDFIVQSKPSTLCNQAQLMTH